MDRRKWAERQLAVHKKIYREERENPKANKDIHNLELILYSIAPGSMWWNRGCIKTLRKAIRLMKKEAKHENKKTGIDLQRS